jgi:hypothetical protein
MDAALATQDQDLKVPPATEGQTREYEREIEERPG